MPYLNLGLAMNLPGRGVEVFCGCLQSFQANTRIKPATTASFDLSI